jgi:GT2 family glycosyltransferase
MSKYEKLNTDRSDKPLEVHLYTLCYNEKNIAPFAVDYWKTVADKVFVLDNGSNDGSIEYFKSIPGVEVIHFGD